MGYAALGRQHGAGAYGGAASAIGRQRRLSSPRAEVRGKRELRLRAVSSQAVPCRATRPVCLSAQHPRSTDLRIPGLASTSRPGIIRRRIISSTQIHATETEPQVTTESPEALKRSWRLSEMVKLRRVYRAVLGATYLLSLQTPLYKRHNSMDVHGDANAASMDLTEELQRMDDEQQDKAVQAIAAMYMTREEIQTSLKLLGPSFGELLQGGPAMELQSKVEARVQEVVDELKTRAEAEMAALPPEAQAKLAAEQDGWEPSSGSTSGGGEGGADAGNSTLAAVVKGEKNLEKYIVKKVAPFVKSQVGFSLQNPGWLVDGAKGAKDYGVGLWERLNGKGSGGKGVNPSELGLPVPVSIKGEVEVLSDKLAMEIDGLEKKVQEASKAREARVRSSGLHTKARLAVELMSMDREVISLSHQLGIRTLELEMLYIFQALEQEALEILEYSTGAQQVIAGPSAGEELALFVAEFSLLNTQLYSVEAECQDGDCLLVNTDGPSAVDLEVLSREIPDLRTRLGIGDGLVFGGGGFSMRRVRMAVSESFAKITEGVGFLVTGLRMLGSDVKSSAMIFLRAAQGGTLKPREVQALRRTVLDFLVFIPFAIILIIPLTPVGHVLIFGFIQRYFPGLYPSQFTQRRQEIMRRYEELQKQLMSAQRKIQEEDEDQELQLATEAVARLMIPVGGQSMGSAKLRDLEAKVAAARDIHLGLAANKDDAPGKDDAPSKDNQQN